MPRKGVSCPSHKGGKGIINKILNLKVVNKYNLNTNHPPLFYKYKKGGYEEIYN
jgi:hypothetical protein